MKDAAVIVGVLVELNHVIHSCSMGWFGLFLKLCYLPQAVN